MPKNVIMPALGVAQETGRVLQWLKAEGERVSENELLLEIETDKATVELEAPASGVLRDVSARPGDDIPVGTVIAKIWAEGETEQASAATLTATPEPVSSHTVAADDSNGAGVVDTTSDHLAAETQSPPIVQPGTNPSSNPRQHVLSSPKAKRLATERGIDLSIVSGSQHGRPILAADVIQHESSKPAEGPIEVSKIWRIMADRLAQAWNTTPHFYLVREVDAGKLVEWRQVLRERPAQDLTLSDLLVKKVATCLRAHPQLNSEWRNGSILQRQEVNIGLAVAIEQGLVVPVIRNPDRMTVLQIAAERSRLVERAGAGKLSLDDISACTFTISNLGMYGVDSFQAIVNPPQAAILAIGRVSPRVVAVKNEPVVRPMVTFTLSCDHRAVDGARAAQFLAALAVSVEQASPLET
jgi:pyruvate dehydrogenase E2 component (dihydrolipoamide acetyltransferase)